MASCNLMEFVARDVAAVAAVASCNLKSSLEFVAETSSSSRGVGIGVGVKYTPHWAGTYKEVKFV